MKGYDGSRVYSATQVNPASIDSMTGVYNRKDGEAMIRGIIQPGGALLVCNVDNCREINRKYGHRAGDQCLQGIARILGFIAGERAIVARVDGNVFVIYDAGYESRKDVEELAARIRNRIESYNDAAAVQVGLTVGTALYRENDTYGSMFTRASEEMKCEMERKNLTAGDVGDENWELDMRLLSESLAEGMKETGGALCREPETFKMVYRYIVRGMTRNDIVATLAIISITDQNGGIAEYDISETMMELLDETLHKTLRVGDLYCKYSNSQYMAIFNGADEVNAKVVCKRIEDAFYARQSGMKNKCRLDCRWERIKGE